jgi:hydroxymethylglutaryl-CoA lyase
MEKITVYEVGPRDGLQSASVKLTVDEKVEMINLLHEAGLKNIEVGSFVHPQRVPNMADSDEVYKQVSNLKVDLGVLIPNEKGLKRAQSVGAKKFNIFLSPLDSFNQRNLGMGLDKIISHYRSMLYGIPKDNIRVYVSHTFDDIAPEKVRSALLAASLLGSTVVLCDTVGIASVDDIDRVMKLTKGITANWAMHLHHNYEKQEKILDNLEAGYKHGIREFDSSIGGLGGCPFSPGSGANLSTEDLVNWAENNNIDAGLNSKDLFKTIKFVNKFKQTS